MNPEFIPESTQKRWRKLYCRKQKGRWAGPHKGFMTPVLFPFRYGNGLSKVLLSFYDAPELCVVVAWDSSMPLDLPDTERCKHYVGIKCFRDVLGGIYEQCKETWPEPPLNEYRRKVLAEELAADPHSKDEDAPTLWDLIIKNGSTWCHL